MRNRMLGLVFLILILVTAGASAALARQMVCITDGSGATGCSPVMTIPTDWTRCGSDAECIRVAWGCCECFAGGISTAINGSSREKHQKRHRKFCPEIYDPSDPALCPQVFACPSRGAPPEYAAPFCNARGRCEFGFRD